MEITNTFSRSIDTVVVLVGDSAESTGVEGMRLYTRISLVLQISFLSLLYNTSRARDTHALPHFSYLASL